MSAGNLEVCLRSGLAVIRVGAGPAPDSRPRRRKIAVNSFVRTLTYTVVLRAAQTLEKTAELSQMPD